MKIVILDGYCENPGDLSWDALAALGELTVYDRTDDTDPAQIAQRIGDAEIIVINKTPITRQVIDACPSLRFITIMATGYNVVDCAYAAQKGIAVANVPAYGRRRLRSLPSRCCLRSACTSATMPRQCRKGAGRRARISASGIRR